MLAEPFVAVVTGAAGGLGGAIVAALLEAGHRVVLLDLKPPVLPAAGSECGLALACDITDESSVQAAARQTLKAFGRCDVLVNNAAVLPQSKPAEDLAVDEWDRTFAVNVRGAFLCCKHFGRPMLDQGAGSIVNLASIGASVPNAAGAYGPSKAAVLGLTRQLAVEWGPRGVRCNAVSPGLVRTPMSEHFYRDERIHAARKSLVPLRRIGEPAEIADVVAFLASPASRYMNGEELVVDGGFLLSPLMNVQRV